MFLFNFSSFFFFLFQFTGEGGSIPFMGMLGEMFPSTQFIITGVLGPSSNAHGPNEFLHIESVTGRTRRARTCRCSLLLRGAWDRLPLALHMPRPIPLTRPLPLALRLSVCPLSATRSVWSAPWRPS